MYVHAQLLQYEEPNDLPQCKHMYALTSRHHAAPAHVAHSAGVNELKYRTHNRQPRAGSVTKDTYKCKAWALLCGRVTQRTVVSIEAGLRQCCDVGRSVNDRQLQQLHRFRR